MKKLLYIGNKLSKHGATSTYIESLENYLSKEGFVVKSVSDKKNKILRMLDMFFTTIFNSYNSDYVLIDTYSTSNFYYALIVSQICRFFNTKYIPILHGGNLPSRLKASPFLSKLIFKNAYYNVAPSKFLLTEFELKGFKNIKYIPNSIEIFKYTFLDRKDFSEPNLLWVRSLATIYNPKMAIDVLVELKKDFPNAKLCMVGPDKENKLEEYENYAKEFNVDVEFTGKLSKEEWIELSKKYTIFINTTHFDNTPLSLIEAMVLGLPIVSTNVGGIPYLVQDRKNALLVNDNDSLKMVKSIKEILSNQTLKIELISNSLELAKSFDWKEVKSKWFEILK